MSSVANQKNHQIAGENRPVSYLHKARFVCATGENRRTRKKSLRRKDENQQETQPTYDAGSGNRIRVTLVGGESFLHCAIPAVKDIPLAE